ncbi:MAG: phage holin family protein [Candidatus Eremiobacteraeota bacterium]|nr:phage holin family protein [Candidatus Eremiobacteraeota bacterium]
MAASQTNENRESPSSLGQLASDIATLVREEMRLAKAEMAEKAKSAGVGAGMLSASAVTALFTLASLTALGIVTLALVLPLWLAVLIATVIWGGVTAGLALLGKRKVADAAPFVPEQTIENIKEDVAWARRGVRPPEP